VFRSLLIGIDQKLKFVNEGQLLGILMDLVLSGEAYFDQTPSRSILCKLNEDDINQDTSGLNE